MAYATNSNDTTCRKGLLGLPITPRKAIRFERSRVQAEAAGWAPWSVRFWRCMGISFCVFSIVGHWMEIPYCLFNKYFFGIVEADSLVFADPMYPFLVYGIAAVLGALLLVPQRDWLKDHYPRWQATLRFFLLCMAAACAGEIIMGLLLNQPDPITGIYPLWDNSHLPFNVLGQAWLVNDFLLGIILTLYTWALYPALVKLVSKVPERWGWPVAVTTVVSFVALCVVKFA
ncbi:MAG: putative ABC transporter permease [Coriobacteriia bacterium]|nr:putative ABC transporter permease [Coriobacteriia bacterium]